MSPRAPGYKGADPPAWTLPGLVSAVQAAEESSSHVKGFYIPPERPTKITMDRLERKAKRLHFANIAYKAKAIKDRAKTEPQREIASKLLIAARQGIGGQTDEAERGISEAMAQYDGMVGSVADN